jgi:DNA-binding transcriptional LysR family regulator
MDFHGIDLNLLVAFDALMNERNVTRAAARVGVSQPAMSAALSRLRTLLADPLFLRSAAGLLPTTRARDLAGPIAQALRQIEATLVQPPVFDPGAATFAFTMGLPDYPAFVLLPSLLAALADEAPGVTVNVRAINHRDDAVDLLDAGAVDAAIGVAHTYADGRIMTQPLLRDAFVTIVAAHHPVAGRPLDLPTFLALPHVLVSPEGQRFGVVDQALAQLGQQRRLALTLPHMFAVPAVVARTQMVATVLARVALYAQASYPVALCAPPLALPDIGFYLLWHRRSDTHPAQAWFRALIGKVAAALPPSPSPPGGRAG